MVGSSVDYLYIHSEKLHQTNMIKLNTRTQEICFEVFTKNVKHHAMVLIFLLAIATGCEKKTQETDNKHEVSAPLHNSAYLLAGNRITALTFDTLRASLLSAISSQGIENAISFCSDNAYDLTDTYADSVSVRRTSTQCRNPNNKPDSLELSVLKDMEAQLSLTKKVEPKIVRTSGNEEIHFFRPIRLQVMCLNCHGTPGTQIQQETLTRIHELYPSDQAVNFKEGDLRGVWHVIFKSSKN